MSATPRSDLGSFFAAVFYTLPILGIGIRPHSIIDYFSLVTVSQYPRTKDFKKTISLLRIGQKTSSVKPPFSGAAILTDRLILRTAAQIDIICNQRLRFSLQVRRFITSMPLQQA
jgi:hypothetical protein